MKIRQWRYFWTCFLAVGLLVYIGFCAYLYWQPPAYEGSVLIEPTELYPGEDLTLPEPPAKTTVEPIVGTRLVRVTAESADAVTVHGGVRNYIDGWREQRRIRFRKKLEAEQAATVQGSAEWRRYEIERRTSIGSGMIFHQGFATPGAPNEEKLDRILARAMGVAAFLALVIVSVLTLRRGEREGDGQVLPWTRLARRFGKIGLVASACYLLVTAIFFAQETDPFVSSATISLPQSTSPEDFQTQLEILSSRELLYRTVRELDLLRHYEVSTRSDAEKILRENIAITAMPDQKTAEIRATAYYNEIATKIPAAIARIYVNRHQDILLRPIHRRQEDLKMLLRRTDDDQLIADISLQLALLNAESSRVPVRVSDITPAEKRAKNWLGWLTDVGLISVLQALLLAAVITIISLLWFSAEAKAAAEERPATEVAERTNTDTVPVAVADPY